MPGPSQTLNVGYDMKAAISHRSIMTVFKYLQLPSAVGCHLCRVARTPQRAHPRRVHPRAYTVLGKECLQCDSVKLPVAFGIGMFVIARVLNLHGIVKQYRTVPGSISQGAVAVTGP